jgi:hypothetical protein
VDTAQNDVSTAEVNPFRALGYSPDIKVPRRSIISSPEHMTAIYANTNPAATI